MANTLDAEADRLTRVTAGETAKYDLALERLHERPGFLVRRLHQIYYAIFYEECKTQNVTPVQYGVLTIVALHPDLDQTSLGQAIGLDRTTTADVIKRLEQRGWLERHSSPADRRTRHVRLTQEGRVIVDSLQSNIDRLQERFLDPLRPAERAMFMQFMRTLVEANGQYSRAVVRSSF